jgi:hypothetical protein
LVICATAVAALWAVGYGWSYLPFAFHIGVTVSKGDFYAIYNTEDLPAFPPGILTRPYVPGETLPRVPHERMGFGIGVDRSGEGRARAPAWFVILALLAAATSTWTVARRVRRRAYADGRHAKLRSFPVMQTFTVHWSPVPGAEEGKALFALWPSPVDHDACFREAGFTDLGDTDEYWDANADGLLTCLLEALSRYGSSHLMSKPVEKYQSWYTRLFSKGEVFDLRGQILLPIQRDELPDCVVGFGESDVSLRTGGGHHLFWITMPNSEAASFPKLVQQVAASHPVARTELRWECLHHHLT